jgi:hypothetical protein
MPSYTVEVQNWAQDANGTITINSMNISIWTSSKVMKDEFTALKGTGQATWYVDQVVPDQSVPYHFHFQGQTLLLTDNITTDLRTSIANISTDPAFYEAGGDGGWPQWAINITVIDVF